MSRFKKELRLSLENADAVVEEAPKVETTEVDVAGGDAVAQDEAAVAAQADVAADAAAGGEVGEAPAAAAATEEVVVTETAGETEEVPVQVEEAADPAAGSGEVEVVDSEAVIVDTSESAEEAVAEANAAEAEADAIEEQKDELEEAAAGLESIYEMMAAAQQTGGLSRQAAQMATLAVESYTTRCGDDSQVMASLENFGGDSTRLRATNLSLESIGEKIKQYWKVIWQFVMNLKNKIWDFIKRLFTAAGRLKARGERLQKLQFSGAAGQLATTAKLKDIEIKGYAKKIAVGTKVVVDPMAGLQDCLNLVTDTTTVSEQNERIAASLYDMIANVSAGKEAAAGDKFAAEFTLPKAFKLVGDSMETKVLPGNIKFVAEQLTLRDGKIKLWKRIAKVNVEANVSEEAKIPTMTPAQINAAGAEAVKLYDAVNAAQSATAKAAQRAKSMKAPTVSESISEENAKTAKELLSAFRTAEIQQANLTAKVCGAAINAAMTYLKVAELSAAAYGAGKANIKAADAA